MGKSEIKTYRQARLQAFLDEKYEGNKARLGRALGYRDGALLGQMLSNPQIRPITEKTIYKIHDLPGGSGWFDDSEPDQEIPSTSTILLSLTDDAVQLGAMFDKMPQEIKAGLYLAVTEYMLQSRRVFLRDGTHPEFLQLDTRPGKSLLLPDEDNEPAPPAGARASQQKRRIRQGTHSQ